MEHLHIVMGNHLKEDKKIIEKYAKDVFSYYNGKLQKSNLEGFKGHYRLHLKNTIPIPIITITFEPSFSQRIGLIVQESYFSSKAFPKKEAESNFFDFIDLAIAMMKASKNSFFIGSFEPGSTSPEQDVPIQVLFFKDKEYLPYLREHIRFSFKIKFSVNLDIPEKELDKLVERYATINKKYGEYTLICFYPFVGKQDENFPTGRFYREVKNLKNENPKN